MQRRIAFQRRFRQGTATSSSKNLCGKSTTCFPHRNVLNASPWALEFERKRLCGGLTGGRKTPRSRIGERREQAKLSAEAPNADSNTTEPIEQPEKTKSLLAFVRDLSKRLEANMFKSHDNTKAGVFVKLVTTFVLLAKFLLPPFVD
jgi:hypothetical protein